MKAAFDSETAVLDRRMSYYSKIAMDKELPTMEYIAALEEKYAEQVAVNRQLLRTVTEQMDEICRLENKLRRMGDEAGIEELLSLTSCHGEA